MPYLSKIWINPMRNAGRAVLSNPHVAHGMIMSGIADQPVAERVLWRVETTRPHRPELLVLSESKPDWSHIVEQAGWPHADGDHYVVRDYVPLFAHLSIGREFAFRLTANPVEATKAPDRLTVAQQRRREAGSDRSLRVGHRTAAHQLEWFLRRTAKWGFEIPAARVDPPAPGLGGTPEPALDVRLTGREVRRFTKKRGGTQVVLNTATFEGRLIVTDPAVLREKLLSGIGPAKAYGCGLLTLAPLSGRHHG